MISVSALTKLYGDFPAVSGLSFDVGPGEVLGLVGPNGAGKTTTLRCLVGIIAPSQGTVAIAGHDMVTDPVEAKRSLALIPHEPYLFEYLTVAEHLEFTARVYGVPDAGVRGPELLRELELADKADAPILLLHGKDDTVVPIEQSETMESALRRAGKPVEFVKMNNEDHWLSREETRVDMLKAAVAFVEKHNPPN